MFVLCVFLGLFAVRNFKKKVAQDEEVAFQKKKKKKAITSRSKRLCAIWDSTAWKCANRSARFGTKLYANMLTS